MAVCTNRQSLPRFCSDRCGRRSQDKRQRSTRGNPGSSWIDPKRRYRIYARDGWVCQLCGDPVDRGLPYNDDWAASLDHIVPKSETLFPDHSDANLRLAHRWCNAVRSDGTYVDDDFFVNQQA